MLIRVTWERLEGLTEILHYELIESENTIKVSGIRGEV